MMSGSPAWGMWVVMITATAAFWAVVFLAVRALYSGRDATGVSTSGDTGSSAMSGETDRLQERLARGEITVAEYEEAYEKLRTPAGNTPAPDRPSSRPSHR